MNELLYDINSGLIALVLFVSMAVAMELGYRIGYTTRTSASDASKEHINGIQASILGILALLLAFTLSLSLQRFDSRSEAVVDEANAIGTAYLRVQLVPAPLRKAVLVLIRDYVDLRVQSTALGVTDHAERDLQAAKVARIHAGLWDHARQGVEVDPNLYPPTLFVEAINGLIDSFGRREAALNRHVPEVVLLLLYATFLMSGTIVGFASGAAGHRPSLVSYIMVALIVGLVFIIIDLDRPRRGFIQVNQKSLLDLQTWIHAEVSARERQIVPTTPSTIQKP
ncbi:MAG: hypothetical protein KA388_04780 [Rhodocyclaceae bacterium]|nr:hypothetical protein [Rhodocyclaceae bacterium]MBP6109585.1 hypothetical protein [Rhodocyclaceae bacterium]MBP6279056.1 hypothetical protein [Rhodocyclaceae bacterium]